MFELFLNLLVQTTDEVEKVDTAVSLLPSVANVGQTVSVSQGVLAL